MTVLVIVILARAKWKVGHRGFGFMYSHKVALFG